MGKNPSFYKIKPTHFLNPVETTKWVTDVFQEEQVINAINNKTQEERWKENP